MSGMLNKTMADIYKDLFYIDNSNNGFDSTLRNIKSGNGNTSGLWLSTSKVQIKHTADDNDAVVIKDKDNDNHLHIDTNNNLFKVGSTQETVNTQFQKIVDKITLDGSNHYAVGMNTSPTTAVTLGTGTDPATTYTIATTADDLVCCMMFVDTAITMDTIKLWVAGADANADTIRFHLMSYDVDTSNSATSGDLSNGVVVASGADISSAGYEQAYQQQLTISTATITANKVLLLCVKADTSCTLSVNATIKYHI